MKNGLRSTLTLLLVGASLLTTTSAWADQYEPYERGPFHFGPMPFFDCTDFDGMDYWLWAEGDVTEVGKVFFNKDGSFKHTVGKVFTADAALWAPADLGCNQAPFSECFDPWTPMAGTNLFTLDDNKGTAEQRTVIWRDWLLIDPDGNPGSGDEYWWPTWGSETGIFFRLVLPGYGAIFNNAGRLVIQQNFETGEWDVIQATPNHEGFDEEQVHAICSYIGNR